MKKFFVFLFLAMLVVTALAQSTPKFSYQAVVRDTNNRLVTNGSNITFKWEVMNASNNVIYTETYTGLTTNANGLLSLQIGDSTVGIGQFWAVEWYNARVRTTISFNGQTIVSPIAPVNAVPYALTAETLNPNGETMKEIYYVIDTVKAHIRSELADTSTNIRYSLDTTKANIRAELADTSLALRTLIQQNYDTLQAHIDTTSAQIRSALEDTARDIRIALVDTANDIRGALLDTASDIRGALEDTARDIRIALVDTANDIRKDIYKGDSTLQAHIDTASVNVRKALVDTAKDIRIALVDTASDIRKDIHKGDSTLQAHIDTASVNVRKALVDTEIGRAHV